VEISLHIAGATRSARRAPRRIRTATLSAGRQPTRAC